MINPITSIIEYIRSSIAELKKVTWPTKDSTIRYTSIVVVVSVALAGLFAVLDMGFSKLVTSVLAEKTSTQETTTEQPVIPDVEPINVETTAPDENGEIKINLDNVETATPDTSTQE
jgi:preprotein translocase SecE subunit